MPANLLRRCETSKLKYLSALTGIWLSLGLVSCAPPTLTEEKRPVSQATAEEKRLIREQLQIISDMMAKLGYRIVFNRLPVIVTTENWKTLNRIGYCRGGRKKYITLNRMVFSGGADQSLLFNVLLHEIGHCYFDRPHDNAAIYKSGFKVVVHSGDDRHLIMELVDRICTSIMCDHTGDAVGASAPRALKEYYVAELLGKARAVQLSDFAKFGRVEFYDPGGANPNRVGMRSTEDGN